MQALALLTMRSKNHAIIILLLLGCLPVFCWLNVAITGFLILQKGKKGIQILPWSVLPFLVLLWVDANTLNYTLIITALIITVCGAFILRATRLWSVVLVSLVPVVLLLLVLFKMFIPGYYNQVNIMSDMVYQTLNKQASYGVQVAAIKEINTYIVDGILQAITFILSIGCLFLARSFQASIYKSQANIHDAQGFKLEYYNIKLNKFSLCLLLLSVIAITINYYFIVITCVMTVPFFIAGLSLCHRLCLSAKRKNILLVVFYTSVIFLMHVMYLIIVLLACIDTICNFRYKLLNKSNITD